ncbi:MAG TPA: TonB-dependent receptor, partial [Verrucomicrobiae bacterium]|nr:TonB-dependent receptor [Verrucomicrobiae bacterium]
MNLLHWSRLDFYVNTPAVKRMWVAAVASILLCAPVFSQTSQGTIQGSVFDQTGGAVVGASVSVVDVARGITRALTTDDAGQYVANNLTPGSYTVRAEAKGFRTTERSGVLVEVGQNIRVDLTVQPGEQTQTVTVTGEVPAINTTDATLGGTVSNEAINSLPLNGRNFQRLLQLRPGVITPVGGTTGRQSTNGRRLGFDVLTVEGIAAIGQTVGTTTLNGGYRGGDSSSVLPIDAIQEFNTEQNPKAEYGWKEGSVINVGIKSGTNSLHGTAYAFGRDAQATDAGNAFRTAGVDPVTPATLEQFGASVGGRIIKDKLFWFANYEGLRDVLGDTAVVSIPSDVAGAGVSRSMVDACNALKNAGTPISPLSAQLSGLNVATCTVSPSSSTVENLWPYNPSTSTSFAPSTTGVINNLPLDNGIFKADYIPGPHHHINGTYYRSQSFQLVNYANGQLLPRWEASVPQKTQFMSGDWTWTPGSTLVNDFRIGYSYLNNQTIPGDSNIDAAAPWPTGYGINTGRTLTQPSAQGLPQIQIQTFTGYLGQGPRSAIRGPEGNVDLADSVSLLHGKHALKLGFDYIDVIYEGVTGDQQQGLITFATLQDFLAGNVLNGTIQAGNPAFNTRDHWYAAFAQDDWRLTPRLTVNLGLRYEYEAPMVEHNNFLSNFDPNVNPLTTPAILQVGPGEPIPAMYTDNKTHFYPRLGMAWDVRGDGKTVVRAGAGILGNAENLFTFNNLGPAGASFPDIGVSNVGKPINRNTPYLLSLNQTPGNSISWTQAGPLFPIGASGPVCSKASQCSSGSADPNFHTTFSYQFNVDVQRAITNNLTVDVAYVGISGHRETMWSDVNQPPLGIGYTPAVISACLAAPSKATCKPSTAAEAAARPYATAFPYLNYISQASFLGWSSYNGLQVTANMRAYHGLSFISGYTYSHALDTGSNLNPNSLAIGPNLKNYSLSYGNSDNDLRHRFTFAPSYAIPGMKTPGQMLEGWSISSIITMQQGAPWSAWDPTAFDWLGTGENGDQANSLIGVQQFWNYTGPKSAFQTSSAAIPCFGNLPGCTPYAGGNPPAECVAAAQAPYTGNAQLQALALAALQVNGCYERGGGILTPPAFGTIGNAGRNTFRGAPYYNVDMSVSKLWRIRERFSAQLRFEFFNLFNRVDFGPPVTSPAKGATGFFGTAICTPDNCSTGAGSNPVLGSGGPRHVQFG